MLTTLTNEIGYLHEQLRDVHEELKRKSTEVGVMSTTITQQNKELIKLKYFGGLNLPFGTSIHDFNENMGKFIIHQVWSDMVKYLKDQIWDHVTEPDEEEDNPEFAVYVVKYSLNDLDCLFHFLGEDIKTNVNVRAAMTELQTHIISKILARPYDGDLYGWMMDKDVTGIKNVFKRHFPEV